ncbi:glycosyltransferase family 4 protein [Cetobacterium sp. 8H]|uniref:glycosyltransferase family 4 protein n=1 Tax=Cetobacterium sp. 8H TaxID=2759681 RepID=UPI00163C27B8|nr:glycosyltransferase family 4 protein [Cetobacterium sp. 8H]MBC2850943.1 glycosyltransferase family 4 protein [Cetobacterium sp. 8H]
MAKKILVICQYYYPEQFKVTDICEELAKIGNDVTVLTGLPNYNLDDIPLKYKNNKNRFEIINGVKIWRVFEIARKKGTLRLILNYLSFLFASILKILKMDKDFDLIFIYQLSPITMALPGILYKVLYKKPIFLYCLDIWPESVGNIIKNKESIIYKMIKKFSSSIYLKADKIGITSKPFKEYFIKEHNIPEKKMIYIPQNSSDSYLEKDFTKEESQDIDLVFMGNIGIAQDINTILKAVEEIKSVENFRVHFVGVGSYLEKAKNFVKEKQLEDKIVFHGQYPVEKMEDFYKIADACLITLRDDGYLGETMPLKLQGYMAAGKMVIGAINGAAAEVINESKCGLCVSAGNWKGLAKIIKELIDNKENCKEYGENGKKYYLKNFTKKIHLETIQQTIINLD